MTVLFSRKCEYALQGIQYLAGVAESAPVSADQISQALGISRDFVAKTLQGMVKAGFLSSVRGKAGGFRLNLPASKISLLDIVLAVDGEKVFNR